MLSAVRDNIIKEGQDSGFIAIQADETMDIAVECQFVLVLRYNDGRNNLQKRFFEFIPVPSAISESIAAILPEDQKSKLICQAYDRASVMRGATAGVQRKIQDVCPNAHDIHCYTISST